MFDRRFRPWVHPGPFCIGQKAVLVFHVWDSYRDIASAFGKHGESRAFCKVKCVRLALIMDVRERGAMRLVTSADVHAIGEFENRIIEGDCLEVMRNFPDGSVDMVLCDLPYGTTQNKWDSIINLDLLFTEYRRVVKPRGVIALTSSGLFTAKLMLQAPDIYKYKMVWVKSKATNFLNAKRQPLRKYEDICVFYKEQPTYHPQMGEGGAYDKGVRKDQLTGSYGDFSPRHVKSDGSRYPTDVVYFKTAESEGPVYHPTQKPVELGRYLVRTFTNPGDIVLDNACGSGSFCVAAALEGRSYIGIEKNEDVALFKKTPIDYIEISEKRIGEALGEMTNENAG